MAAIRDAAPQVAVDPIWRPPSLLPGERVRAYQGPNTMLLDEPRSKADTLVVSSTPLVAADETGVRALVDTTLQDTGGGWRPVNVPAKTEIGRTIGGGIAIGEDADRLVVTPGGQKGAVGRLVGNKVFYANSDVDTDTIAEAVPTGASIAWTLRSPEAKESQTLHFDLPAGVAMRAQGPGLVLTRGGLAVGSVAPPAATDAQGTALSAKYVVDGAADVRVEVPYRKSDVAFPISIDPVVQYGGSVPTLLDQKWDGSPLTDGWWFSANGGGACCGWSAAFTGVFDIWGTAGSYGSAWWANSAPNASFITRAEFPGYQHLSAGTTLTAGIYNPYSGSPWSETHYGAFYRGSQSWAANGPVGNTGGTTPGWAVTCVDYNCSPYAGTAGNVAVVQLSKTSSSPSSSYGGFDGGYLFLRDNNDPTAPTFTGVPSTWTTTTSFSGIVASTDAGLGIEYIVQGTQAIWWSNCDGGVLNRCPGYVAASYSTGNLPDGLNPISFKSIDLIGRESTIGRNFYVDNHAPTIRLSDALWARRGRTISRKAPLRVKATDPLGGGRGSGITTMKIEFALDSTGSTWADLKTFTPRSCPTNYCESVYDQTWTFDPEEKNPDDSPKFTPGSSYFIRAVAYDAAGNPGYSEPVRVTIGTGSIPTLDEGTYTARRVKLQALAKNANQTGVTFKYRIPSSPDCDEPTECWQPIPTANITQDRDQAVASWPLSLTQQKSPVLTWDVATTTADVDGAFHDRRVQVRAEFAGGLAGTSEDIVFNVDRSGIKTSDSTEAIGPGSVDLITGNLAFSATDVSISSPIADLTVARTYNSRSADDGPLGPKWQLSFPVPQAGGADFVALDDATSETDEDGYAFESVTVTAGDASTMVFEGYRTASESTTYYASTNGDTDYELSRTGDTFKLVDENGNTTTFVADGSSITHFLPSTVEQPGGATAIGYGRDSAHQNRVIWVFGPQPTGSTCSVSTLDPECRALHLAYDGNGRLSTVALSTAAPDGSGGYTRLEQTVAQYEYESTGSHRLTGVFDPRISPNLKTTYAYDADNLLTTVTPPGEQPWTMDYTTGTGDGTAKGRLRSASRPTLDSGGNPSTPAQTTVVYDVPRTGGGAPYEMGQATTATWGQTDLPATATAIFPASQVPASPPTSYSKATIDYVDAFGYTVNEADPSGAISTSEHDHYGNVVRALAARNRERALAATDTDATSRQLDTQSTYSADGKDLVDELGPLRSVKSGGTTASGRRHTAITYDEGKPSTPADTNYHLPTTTTVGLQPTSAFPATSVLDDANRSDSSSLGSGWTAPSWSPSMRIVSNQFAAPAGGADAWVFRSIATSGADSEAYIKLATFSSSAVVELYLRTGSDSGDGYSVRAYNGQIELHRDDGFARTTLKTISQPVADGDALGARMVGAVLTAYYKPSGGAWTALGSATDSRYAAAGQIGFHLNSTAARVDDFGGGTVTSGGGDSDIRITKNGYKNASGVDSGTDPTGGWVLRKPTSVTVDPGGGHLSLTTRTQYNDRGQITLASRPADSAGNTAGTTIYRYWQDSSACVGYRQMAGMLCQTAPAASSPALPTTSLYYNALGEVVKKTDSVAGGPDRTQTITYDAAGRKLADSVDGLDRNINGLLGWWKADAITGLHDGDAVSSWADSSGNGRTLTQSTSSKRPTYRRAPNGPGRFPSTGVLDDANRADASSLGDGWESFFWAENTARIDDHEIAADADGNYVYQFRSAGYGPDSEVFTKLAVKPSWAIALLYLRFDPDTGNGYVLNAYDGQVIVSRWDDWNQTTIKTIDHDFSDGDSFGARIVGDQLTVYAKSGDSGWASIGGVTDDTHMNAGKVGFEIDTTVTRLDDFGGGTVAGRTAAQTPTLDHFDRSNGTLDSGNWSPLRGLSPLSVDSNEVANPSGDRGSYWNADTFGPDTDVHATVTTPGAGIDLYARLTNPGSSSFSGYCASFGASGASLWKAVNGSWTELGTTSTGSLAAGDVVSLTVIGNTLTAFVDGQSIISRTDNDLTGPGKIGIELEDTTPNLDDFGGGTIPSGGSLGVPVVHHDGADDFLEMSSGVTNAKTVFVVANWQGAPADNRPLLGGSTYDDFHGGASDGTGLGAGHLWYSTGVNSKINGGNTRINGDDVSFTAATKPADGRLELMEATTNGTDQLRFDRTTGDRSYADRVWFGDYAEIIAYDHILTSTERANVEGYLMEKYGISGDVHATDVGASEPTTSYTYSTTTGRLLTTSAAGKDLTRVYDKLGRLTTYTDADGATSTTSYDSLGRVATFDDGKGTQTFTYDDRNLPTQITDSQLGTITGSYDADGQLTRETLPGGLKLLQSYDETGDPVRRCYTRNTSNTDCGATSPSPWIDMTALSNVHGQIIDESISGIGTRNYSYDLVGRLTQTQDTPSGGSGCTTRVYGYDADSNRTSLTTRAPGSGGACATSGGTTVSHSYLDADRLNDSNVSIDRFGRTLTLPAADAGGSGHDLTATYYVDDLARSITQDGQTTTLLLDPAERPRLRLRTGATDETEHYSDDTDSPSWTERGINYERSITGLDGDLIGTHSNTGGPTLLLTDLHGDTIAQTDTSTTSTTPTAKRDQDEFGVPIGDQGTGRFQWLGSKQRQTQTSEGVITMGARLYVPQLGRFLQTDPIPGGSANPYDYANQDPVNQLDLSGECPICVIGGYEAAVLVGGVIFAGAGAKVIHDKVQGKRFDPLKVPDIFSWAKKKNKEDRSHQAQTGPRRSRRFPEIVDKKRDPDKGWTPNPNKRKPKKYR